MVTSLVSLNSTVAQVKGNLVTDMEGSTVMLNIEQGKYYNLGAIGGEIWNLMESPISIYSIINQMVHIYDVEYDICEKEVYEFISQLISNDLAVVTN